MRKTAEVLPIHCIFYSNAWDMSPNRVNIVLVHGGVGGAGTQ